MAQVSGERKFNICRIKRAVALDFFACFFGKSATHGTLILNYYRYGFDFFIFMRYSKVYASAM
jgi:hypothetical protein